MWRRFNIHGPHLATVKNASNRCGTTAKHPETETAKNQAFGRLDRKVGDEVRFNHYPGYWQVRQIAGAHWARSFWLQVIAEFTEGDFLQFQQTDPVWGIVDVQTFQSKPQV